jgi:predicted nucleic acid-binding protein
MPAVEKIYLDTNVFILAFENAGMATQLLRKLFAIEGEEPLFATSELTLSELLVRPIREANAALINAYEATISRSPWLEVVPVGKPILRHAAMLRAGHASLKLPDAIHVSTAFATRCSHMLTSDTGLKHDYEIDGAGNASKRAPLATLRPDDATLTSLIESMSR